MHTGMEVIVAAHALQESGMTDEEMQQILDVSLRACCCWAQGSMCSDLAQCGQQKALCYVTQDMAVLCANQ